MERFWSNGVLLHVVSRGAINCARTPGICATFRSRVQVLGEPPAVSEEVQALMNEAGITDLQKSGLLYLSNDARVRPVPHRA